MSNLKQVLSQHGEDPLSSLMRMIMNRKPYAEHDPLKAVEDFLQQKNQRKTHVERKRTGDQSTNED